MKTKSLSGISALIVALLIIGAIFVPAVSAQPQEPMEVATTDEATLRLIDELWGTDITIGEYLEKVDPEALTDMPDEVKKDVYQRKMPWSADDQESTNALSSPSLVVHAMLSKSVPKIDFGVSAQVYGAVPEYLYVAAYLRNSTTDQTVGTTAHSVFNASYDEATNMVYYPPDGTYRVYAWGYSVSPNLEDAEWAGPETYP